jgi:hypothetical protein
MMFLSALDAGALKATFRRSSHLGWKETGGTLKIEDLEETHGPKLKGNSLVNDVRKMIGDPTKIKGLANSHQKTSFLFL